ncbi:MAG TPA: shikimate kinase [Tepidisphaeraceae bacterium]|jgi:shikimate kinase|nr:shikimate kinase [Tepidisphaeraceae bacterium]
MTNDPSLTGLIGYRGSGKTTVGKLLADELHCRSVDIDQCIVSAAGKSIREIFEEAGEPAFRDLETKCIGEAMRLQNAVVSFGGGALDREENRKMMTAADCRLIYLRCEPAELLRRIRSDPQTAVNRPNLTALGGGIDEIQAVLARREPVWRGMIVAEIDVTALSPVDVVKRCLESL